MRLCLRRFFYEPPPALQTGIRLSDYLAMDYPNTSMPFNQDMPCGPYALPGLIPSWNMYPLGNPHMLPTTSNIAAEEPMKDYTPSPPIFNSFMFPMAPKVLAEEPMKDYTPSLTKEERAAPFATVNGRMALSNTKRNYEVTVGEIARRASFPESLSTNMLNGILRNAKVKDNAGKLRAKLKECNISVADGKQRMEQSYAFTALTEGEAAEMAREFHLLLQDHGGVSDISNFLHMEEMARGGAIIPELSIVRKWLTKITEIHPEGAQPDGIVPKNACERAINHLSLISHGFSHAAVPKVLRFAVSIVDKIVLLQEQVQKVANGNRTESSEFSSLNSMAGSVGYPFVPNQHTTHGVVELPSQPVAPQVNPEVLPGDFSTMNQWSQEELQQFQQRMMADYDANIGTEQHAPEDKNHKIFEIVPGRMVVYGEPAKYSISIGELCRRVSAPESLQISVLKGILRIGKGRNSSRLLRTTLLDCNIELPRKCGKQCTLTSFTALCEEEAQKLAKDFRYLLHNGHHSGQEEIGNFLADSNMGTEKETIIYEVGIVRTWLQKLVQLHPIDAQPHDLNPTNEAERAVHHLSLMSHGFSHIAIPSVLEFAAKILETVGSKAALRPALPLLTFPMMSTMPMYSHMPGVNQQMPTFPQNHTL